MTIARRPSPFGELLSLRQAMDRLFEDSFVRPGNWGDRESDFGLPLDVSTTADELVIEASLPGAKPEDVEITVENGTLTIRGETASEQRNEDGGYVVREIRRGSFSRSVNLPAGLEPDKAEAAFENGILTLRIPKAEQVKPKQIRISPTANGTSHTNGTSHASGSSPDEGSQA
ncbi:MAG TPA: Hsp20/alpha crystallin family protein [Candidatus Limnocylindrales bacterium]|nr:Hsp20/alpha crystallin family protein [Candidatus Limnocylindrales bacterium]